MNSSLLQSILKRALNFAGLGRALCAVCGLLFCNATYAADSVVTASEVPGSDASQEIFSILRRNCFECHGPQNQDDNLQLGDIPDVIDSGNVVPGSSLESELVRRVLLPDGDPERMPPIGKRLSETEINTLRMWIDQGAHWPDDFQAPSHWAYDAPIRPELPVVQNLTWPNNEIDYFVLHQLESRGIAPAPPARAETLIRRVFLDLIGLPPSPEEVQQFVANPSDQAYAALVDNLLQRPQFGERWGRPWLDAARYADSHGFQRDDFRDVWAYRDWVIQALNADMPFDQFTIEQLAGDLLPGATPSQRIATGFHRIAPINVEAGSLPEETRIQQIIERTNTTAAIWLGSTFECAQCHDHKYDPISHKEYYQFFAYFNNTQQEADLTNPSVPSSIQFQGPSIPLIDMLREKQRVQAEAELAGVKAQLAARRKALEADLETWGQALRERVDTNSTEIALEPLQFRSEGNTDRFEILGDHSVLLQGGDPPATDVYEINTQLSSAQVYGFRVEALTHPSLPNNGPGRGNSSRPNFILNEFSVELLSNQDQTKSSEVTPSQQALKFKTAYTDFAQRNFPVRNAIDGNLGTGWGIAPRFNQAHSAIFELVEPLRISESTPLLFRLHQKAGNAQTIGRFRISALTDSPQKIRKLEKQHGPLWSVAEQLNKPSDQWSEQDRLALLNFSANQDPESQSLIQQQDSLSQKINQLKPDTTQVMVELAEPRKTSVLLQGDYRRLGEPVEPGVPALMHAMSDGPPNRLTLAKWIVNPSNPLVARVTVNRWWNEIFGRGIVSTVEDFGIKGEPPSHPQLLDWLAVEFMEQGWSMKQILRQIVLSATYQQSSATTPEALELDDLNILLARGPRFRMDAETIRDNALAISGLISLKQFGPSIRPYQPLGIWTKVGGQSYEYVVSEGDEKYRRGIYVVIKRGSPYPSFLNFDASSRTACTLQRSRTNTPLQALTLLNDPVYVEASQALAHRIIVEKPDTDFTERVVYAFQLCTARIPAEFEIQTLKLLYQQQLQTFQQRDEDAKLLIADLQLPPEVEPAAFAAWYSVAAVLMNLHETITKE